MAEPTLNETEQRILIAIRRQVTKWVQTTGKAWEPGKCCVDTNFFRWAGRDRPTSSRAYRRLEKLGLSVRWFGPKGFESRYVLGLLPTRAGLDIGQSLLTRQFHAHPQLRLVGNEQVPAREPDGGGDSTILSSRPQTHEHGGK